MNRWWVWDIEKLKTQNLSAEFVTVKYNNDALLRSDTVANMTKEEALSKLSECQKNCDTAIAHPDADDVLCALLESLGYGDVVVEYKKVDRWFS